MEPKIIVFASGTKDSGGSGFENLVNASGSGVLNADIVAVVSNHERGGVRERADRLGIPFFHFPKPQTAERYQRIVKESGAEWVALSGWMRHVAGLDSARTFNVHPALLSSLGGRFGGVGLYGLHVHEAVKNAFDAGEVAESGLSMHFVTDEYDRGPVFFEYRVPLEMGITTEVIAEKVNAAEHEWQPTITNLVVHGEIRWDGKNPASLVVPEGYKYAPRH